jgi:hypothetical protein
MAVDEFMPGDRIQWMERPGGGPPFMKTGTIIAVYNNVAFFVGMHTAGPQVLPTRLLTRIS